MGIIERRTLSAQIPIYAWKAVPHQAQ
jgi:hypothetical protein